MTSKKPQRLHDQTCLEMGREAVRLGKKDIRLTIAYTLISWAGLLGAAAYGIAQAVHPAITHAFGENASEIVCGAAAVSFGTGVLGLRKHAPKIEKKKKEALQRFQDRKLSYEIACNVLETPKTEYLLNFEHEGASYQKKFNVVPVLN